MPYFQSTQCNFMQKAQTISKYHSTLFSSLFPRYSSEDTPSLLHINSIASPSFRWSIDGESMEKPKSFIERHSGNIRRQYLSFIFTHKYHIHSFIHHRNMTSIDIYTNITISIQTERISLSPNSPAQGNFLSVRSVLSVFQNKIY